MSDSDESEGNSHVGDSGEYCCTCESCDAEIFGDSGNLEESDDFCDSGGFCDSDNFCDSGESDDYVESGGPCESDDFRWVWWFL